MGEEDMPDQESQPKDSDPLYISPEEKELIQKKVDDQGTGFFDAVREVFNNAARFDAYLKARLAADDLSATEKPETAVTTDHPTFGQIQKPRVDRLLATIKDSPAQAEREAEVEKQKNEDFRRTLRESGLDGPHSDNPPTDTETDS